MLIYYNFVNHTNMYGFDLQEFIKRILKYLVMGIAIAFVAYVIPKQSLNLEEILVMAISAAAIFAICDVFLPSIASSVRQGAGLGIGAGLVGGIPFRPM
jgi:ABC-type Co2+ transport system permease subunit